MSKEEKEKSPWMRAIEQPKFQSKKTKLTRKGQKKNAARTDKGLWFEQPLLLTVGHKPSTISL